MKLDNLLKRDMNRVSKIYHDLNAVTKQSESPAVYFSSAFENMFVDVSAQFKKRDKVEYRNSSFLINKQQSLTIKIK